MECSRLGFEPIDVGQVPAWVEPLRDARGTLRTTLGGVGEDPLTPPPAFTASYSASKAGDPESFRRRAEEFHAGLEIP